MPGHPDGQNYSIWRGIPLFASSSTPFSNGSPIIKVGYVTNFASIRVRASVAPANGMTVNVQYFTDATLAVPVGGYNWPVPNSMSLDVIAPALGNYVQVTVSTTTVAVTNIALAILGMNVGAVAPTYPYPVNDISAASVVILATGTLLVPLPFVMAGRCHFAFRDINSSAKLSFFVTSLNLDGTAGPGIAQNLAPQTQSFNEFTVDATPLAVSISNSDAVTNHNAAYFLSVDGR